MDYRKLWNKYTEGWFGNIVYIFLGLAIAYSINFGLAIALNTQTPVVSVVSESMEHVPVNNILCGKVIEKYNENSYWAICGPWYESRNIKKSDFDKFPFSNGFNKGDVLFVMNATDYKVGDVIVFNIPGVRYPIIHRIVSIDKDNNIETKGDHNPVQDNWKIRIKDINGKAVFIVPYVGWLKVGFMQILGII